MFKNCSIYEIRTSNLGSQVKPDQAFPEGELDEVGHQHGRYFKSAGHDLEWSSEPKRLK